GSRDFNDHKLLKWYSDSIIIFLATVFRVVSIFEPPCSWTYNNWPAICIKTCKMHHETPPLPDRSFSQKGIVQFEGYRSHGWESFK
ncbi:MAG: hypothetical protein IJR53_05520, partial [Bacteroidales bacterium]|nr:hypothetical protein [Bacteroidales bacterium]